MDFRTAVKIDKSAWQIQPTDRFLFVGSCFAAEMGQRFVDNLFPTTVNPFGVMYNPASILHTLQRMFPENPCHEKEVSGGFQVPDVVVLTLGTNHVYILNETGEIVDNCEKRPQKLFTEKQLSVDECARYLEECILLLRRVNADVKVIITVSPIRYAKYGFHGSQLSKATLLLSVHEVIDSSLFTLHSSLTNYFPAYEIMNDELRDYRFYKEDMLHPSQQAVEYIYQRFADTFFSDETHGYIRELRPIRQALSHRPFNPDSEEYRQFLEQAQQRLAAFKQKYGIETSHSGTSSVPLS